MVHCFRNNQARITPFLVAVRNEDGILEKVRGVGQQNVTVS